MANSNFSRLGMGPPRQTGSRLGMGPPGQTLSQLGMGPPGQTLVNWAWHLQEKQLLVSETRTRAAGGGEVKTGEKELLSMQELR